MRELSRSGGVRPPPATVAAAPETEVPRPRVDGLLERSTIRPLTVVSGPAGIGKTVLLGAYARRTGPAWVTVRPEHADPGRLWQDIAGALAARGHELGGIDPVAGRPRGGPHRGTGPRPTGPPAPVLVLDDLDRAGPMAAAVVSRLLDEVDEAGDGLRLVVAARSEPALGLPRRRIAGAVAEVRAADLVFTGDEAAELLARAGVRLGAEQADRLVARTEGWAAGLRLATLALQGGEDPERFLAEFAGDDSAVADYLVGELLSRLDDGAREFLVRTSIVDRLSGGLADALTGDTGGEQRLRELERSGCPVVRLDDHGRWFRYHGLLAELLRSRLRQRGDALAGELHARAAEWLVEHGHGQAAVGHLVAARDPHRVGPLLGDRWLDLLLDPPPPRALVGADGRLPADERVRVVAAAACLDRGRPAEALRTLDALDGRPSVVTAVARMVRARATGDLDAVLSAARTLEAPSDDDRGRWRLDDELRLLRHVHVGVAAFEAGARGAAEEALVAAITLAREQGQTRPLVDALARSAVLALVDGHLGHATVQARSAVALLDTHRDARSAAAWAYATLAAVSLLRDEPASVAGFLDLGASAAHTAHDAAASAALRTVRGHVEVATAAAGEGARLLRTLALESGRQPLLHAWMTALGPRPIRSHEPGATELEEAAARLRDGDALSAARRTDRLLDPWSTAHRTQRVHAHVVAALARHAVGQPKAATAALEAALELAGPEALWQPFTVHGPSVARLLAHHAESPSPQAARAAEIAEHLHRPGSPAEGPVDALSARERQVLRLLPTLMSSTQIGAELFVSVNTVKTHTRSIYRKLGVSSRRAAVVRAQRLGLL